MVRAFKKPLIGIGVGLLISGQALSDWRLDIEAGTFMPERNRVQIPNDSRGDRFGITELGTGSFAAGRLVLSGKPSEKHELQFVYAPFAYEEKGVFNRDIRFDGSTFAQGAPVAARYQFSSYRLRYLYHWKEQGRWSLDVGGTLFVRDAAIRLRAPGVESEDSNIGFVPLFALRTSYRLDDRWTAMLDTDLAFAPQGRAIDLALLGQYRVDDRVTLSAGYRTIEGGADNDDVYSFAWFNGAVIRAAYAW